MLSSIFSILLILSIFKSRNRVNINDSIRERKRLFKDIRFSISLISMNLSSSVKFTRLSESVTSSSWSLASSLMVGMSLHSG